MFRDQHLHYISHAVQDLVVHVVLNGLNLKFCWHESFQILQYTPQIYLELFTL